MSKMENRTRVMSGKEAEAIIYDEFKHNSKISNREIRIEDRTRELGRFLDPDSAKSGAIRYLNKYPDSYVTYSHNEERTDQGDWTQVIDSHKVLSRRNRDDGTLEEMELSWYIPSEIPHEVQTV